MHFLCLSVFSEENCHWNYISPLFLSLEVIHRSCRSTFSSISFLSIKNVLDLFHITWYFICHCSSCSVEFTFFLSWFHYLRQVPFCPVLFHSGVEIYSLLWLFGLDNEKRESYCISAVNNLPLQIHLCCGKWFAFWTRICICDCISNCIPLFNCKPFCIISQSNISLYVPNISW